MSRTKIRTPGGAFLRTIGNAKAIGGPSRCSIVGAIWPFMGYSEFTGVNLFGSLPAPQYGDTWPKVYTTLTETWTGGYVRSVAWQDFFYGSALYGSMLMDVETVTTGSPPPPGDFYSISVTVGATSISTTGLAGTYNAVLTVQREWDACVSNCKAMLDLMTIPDLPTVVPSKFSPNAFGSPNIGAKFMLHGSGTNYEYQYDTSGAYGSYTPAVWVGAAAYGLPLRVNNEAGGMICKPGAWLSDAIVGVQNTNFGAILCAKSTWDIRSGFDTGAIDGVVLDNQGPHRSLYTQTTSRDSNLVTTFTRGGVGFVRKVAGGLNTFLTEDAIPSPIDGSIVEIGFRSSEA